MRRRRRVATVLMCVVASGCSGGSPSQPVATSAPAGTADSTPTTGTSSGTSDVAAISVALLPVTGAPIELGEPQTFEIAVTNGGGRSEAATVELALVGPDGEERAVHRTTLFVPAGEAVSESVPITTTRWYAAPGDFQVIARLTEPPPAVGQPVSVTFQVGPTRRTIPTFLDVTESAGLTTTVPEPTCGQFANGAAWGDVDSDGWPDLLVTRLGQPVQLFVNGGDGTFSDETVPRGVDVSGVNGAAMADYDDDGDQDVMLVGDAADVLLRNDGTGRFDDVTADAGVAGAPDLRGMSATWGDFDDDGLLDLYVTNYMRCTGPWTTAGDVIENVEYAPDVLYHNAGDGTFDDVTTWLPDADSYGAGFTAAWIDVDDDGLLDLYVGNDFVGTSPDHNRLWLNSGPGPDGWTFTDVSLDSGAGLYMDTMGIGVADVDRDGDLDLALSNIGGNKLMRGDGDGTFIEDGQSGIERPVQALDQFTVTWGAAFSDFDLDGWEDLYLAAGNLQQGPGVVVGPQPNMVLLNDGSGARFLDVSAVSGADGVGESKGVALADYDRDGAVDVFVVDQSGSPRLYRNVTPIGPRHWLEVGLEGTVSNRDGCGARVRVLAGDAVFERWATCGSGATGSSHEHIVHVGLGEVAAIDRIEVTWPSGQQQVIDDAVVDHLVRIVEPGA